MSKNLELLHEGIVNEVDELDSFIQHSDTYIYKNKRNSVENKLESVISNLRGLSDSLYVEYENNYENEYEELKQKYDILTEILNESLPHEEKTYLRIKYNIEI